MSISKGMDSSKAVWGEYRGGGWDPGSDPTLAEGSMQPTQLGTRPVTSLLPWGDLARPPLHYPASPTPFSHGL